ncbi:transmembrane protein 134 isoform 5-T5 [Hipposideros larvatus]
MTPSSCPWRTRALCPSPAGSPASDRCTSSAGPGSRWPMRTSSPGCATRTWRTMRMEPRPLQSQMEESASGTPSLSPCTIPHHIIMIAILKGLLPCLSLPPHWTYLCCRDSCRTSIRSSQWSFSTISNSTQRSYNACCSWTQHPLIQKNRRVVLASFLLLLLGLDISQGLSGALLRKQSLVSLPGRVSAHGDLQLSADPDRRGTGGGPLARCLQRHLLRAWLSLVGPGSLPRDLHLLCGQGPPRLPVLLPALLREVS